MSVLDAGCGSGRWALEIAARRPDWTVHGIDRDAAAISQAQADACSLGLKNVSFAVQDFLRFNPSSRFSVILSVASAHYLVEAGKGKQLFKCFQEWLSPGGLLVLYGPRRHQEVPQALHLRPLPAHEVFSLADLEEMCHAAQFECESIHPQVGKWGVLAKQLASHCRSRLQRLGAYPFEILLDAVDRVNGPAPEASAAWLVLARQPSRASSL
ncbi:MAG: class I SAM-dependent methyltransferase [Acidobacteriota bacterium]